MQFLGSRTGVVERWQSAMFAGNSCFGTCTDGDEGQVHAIEDRGLLLNDSRDPTGAQVVMNKKVGHFMRRSFCFFRIGVVAAKC